MSEALQALIQCSKGVDLPFPGDFRVDDEVLAKFPEGTKVISASRFGTSRLDLQLPDGTKGRYFLKSASGDHGHTMMEGEFHTMSELFKWAPDFVPKPHSWGKYQTKDLEVYFFLAEFIDMSQEKMPDPEKLCERLARLHKESMSPGGQFGFHITVCQGRVPQSVSWESSWTVFFTKLLKHVINMDFKLNGPWEALELVEQRLLSEGVPRLLGVLEQDGRSVKPCLIHSDLWE